MENLQQHTVHKGLLANVPREPKVIRRVMKALMELWIDESEVVPPAIIKKHRLGAAEVEALEDIVDYVYGGHQKHEEYPLIKNLCPWFFQKFGISDERVLEAADGFDWPEKCWLLQGWDWKEDYHFLVKQKRYRDDLVKNMEAKNKEAKNKEAKNKEARTAESSSVLKGQSSQAASSEDPQNTSEGPSESS